MENEDVIRRRMEHTREALTAKLETLEHKLANSVTAVTDTVANVKEKVQEGVESVKEAADVKAHVQRHPWLMFGGSVLCGYMLSELLPGEPKRESSRFTLTPTPPTPPNGAAVKEAEGAPSAADRWLAKFEPEIQHLKSLALGVTLGTVREMLSTEVPPHMAEQLREIIDSITTKAGGDPIPSSDWESTNPAAPAGSGYAG